MVQSVKHLSAMQETRVQFLGQEIPMEKEMATHSSILAWRIPWTEEPGRLQFMAIVHSVAINRMHVSFCITIFSGYMLGLPWWLRW